MEKRNALMQWDRADSETSGNAAIHTKLTAVCTEALLKRVEPKQQSRERPCSCHRYST